MTPIKRCWRPQGRFLRDFARTGSVSAACRAAGLPRRTVYRWRNADADFRRRWDAARGRAIDHLRDAALERALVGDEIPVWHDGRIVDHVRESDPQALWKMLQILQPETYGPRAAELQAQRARNAEFKSRLDEGDKRVQPTRPGCGPRWRGRRGIPMRPARRARRHSRSGGDSPAGSRA